MGAAPTFFGAALVLTGLVFFGEAATFLAGAAFLGVDLATFVLDLGAAVFFSETGLALGAVFFVDFLAIGALAFLATAVFGFAVDGAVFTVLVFFTIFSVAESLKEFLTLVSLPSVTPFFKADRK